MGGATQVDDRCWLDHPANRLLSSDLLGGVLGAQFFRQFLPLSQDQHNPQALLWTLIAIRSAHVRAFGGIYSASSWQE
jgi:hypothetical protein